MKRGVLVFLILLLLVLASCDVKDDSRDFNRRQAYDQIRAIDYPFDWPDPDERKALSQAFETESKAMALYRKILDEYPRATLFSSALITQEFHVTKLEDIYLKYEYEIPEVNWYAQVSNFTSSKDGCAAAYDFAEEAILQYETDLEKVDNEDILTILEAIKRDYETIYLPRFASCR